VKEPPAAFQRALEAHVAGDLAAAEQAYRDTIAECPDHAHAHSNLGKILADSRRLKEALDVHEIAARLNPDCAIVHSNRGAALFALRRWEEAAVAYETGLAIDPDHAVIVANYADTLCSLGRYDEAVARAQRALWLQPDLAQGHCALALAYWGLGRNAASIAAYRVSIALNPQLAMAHMSLGMLLLQAGEFTEGWREWGWRFVAQGLPLRPHPYPLWTGGALVKKLLVWGEQGPGDEIMHAGLAADLAAREDVIWECDARLVPLFARSIAGVRFVARQDPPLALGDDVEAHVPAGSLGQVLRPSTEMFPNRAGYLRADPARVAELRAKLSLTSGRRLVGISWSSANASFGAKKSTRLADWRWLLKTPGCRFVDLQYGDTAQEREGLPLEHIDGLDLKNDLEGLAALIACCDVVITVSNTTAHLAAALGVPTWILVAAGGGRLWYWGDENTDTTLWYPGARIIRQRPGETWAQPLNAAAAKLRDLLEQETTRCPSPSPTNASRKVARSSAPSAPPPRSPPTPSARLSSAPSRRRSRSA
jgi:tetratricopeptide (TPR) repeat protein